MTEIIYLNGVQALDFHNKFTRLLLLLAWLLVPLIGQAASINFTECEFSYPTPPDAECGRLRVLENPQKPAGKQIALNVMRIPAVNKSEPDPLFIIVGGPGGAAVQGAARLLPYFRGIQQERDIIFVDQRGTGQSNGLHCDFAPTQLSPLSDAERQQRTQELLASCIAGLDANLRFYTTPYAVRDLEQVRRALGYPHINLWGVSYGTRVILHYMRAYPESIRAVVLDGVAPVSIQLPRFAEEDASRALGLIFQQCENAPACAAAFGDLRSQWLDLLKALEAKPRTVTLYHPRTGKPVPTHVSAATLSSWVRLALYSRELAPLLPLAIHRAVNQDFSVLGTIALLAMEEVGEHISQGMQMTVLCAEDQAFPGKNSAAPINHNKALLQLGQPQTFAALCQELPEFDLPPDYFEPVQSDIPALLLSGNYDPVTPPRWAEKVAQGLTHARHLVAPGAHHGVTMQGCTAQVMEAFIEAGTLKAIEPECIKAIQPKVFFIDAAGPMLESQP